MFCPVSQKHEVSLGCGNHLLFFVYIIRKFHAKTAWNWRFSLTLFLASKMKKADSFMILRCIILWIRKSRMEKNVTDRTQLRRVRRFNLFPNWSSTKTHETTANFTLGQKAEIIPKLHFVSMGEQFWPRSLLLYSVDGGWVPTFLVFNCF